MNLHRWNPLDTLANVGLIGVFTLKAGLEVIAIIAVIFATLPLGIARWKALIKNRHPDE